MAQYQCSKCGTKAYSKCVGQRNIFPGVGEYDKTQEERVRDMVIDHISNAVQFRRADGFKKSYVPQLVITLWSAAVNPNPPTPDDKDFDMKTIDWSVQQPKEEEAAFEFLQDLRGMTDEELKRVLCSCRWVLLDDQCDLGCCKKEAK